MLKYFVLNRLKKRFLFEKKALDIALLRESIKDMPPEKVNSFNALYKEINDKIEAVDLLFKS